VKTFADRHRLAAYRN